MDHLLRSQVSRHQGIYALLRRKAPPKKAGLRCISLRAALCFDVTTLISVIGPGVVRGLEDRLLPGLAIFCKHNGVISYPDYGNFVDGISRMHNSFVNQGAGTERVIGDTIDYSNLGFVLYRLRRCESGELRVSVVTDSDNTGVIAHKYYKGYGNKYKHNGRQQNFSAIP
jgi:hypothetical protein